MQQNSDPGSSLTITCILKLWNASFAVQSGYVMTWDLKCACWADGENHNDELSGNDSFMHGWAEGENHNNELSGDDSFMYGWAEGENHNNELSGDDSCMYGWAEGENHNDELSGDNSRMYDTYNQRIEWFWECLKKESGWMYFGTWQVTQESLESLSVVFISSGSKIVKRLRRRQNDPLIIERTIGLVLGPCTALYWLFLKHCTLTKKTVGIIWRALFKPPLRPLWLLVGTPSAIRPELAFSRAEHSLPYSDVTIYIFAILYLSSMLYVYRFLWPLRLGWLLIFCLYKEVYLPIFKRVSFWLHGCCGEREGWARKPG